MHERLPYGVPVLATLLEVGVMKRTYRGGGVFIRRQAKSWLRVQSASVASPMATANPRWQVAALGRCWENEAHQFGYQSKGEQT